MQSIASPLIKAQKLHQQVQARFRARAVKRKILPAQGVFLDQYQIPCLQYFNTQLKQCEKVDLTTQIRLHVDMLERIASYVENLISEKTPLPCSDDERDLFGDYRKPILA